MGGTVDYDWRWGNYNPDIIDNDGKWRAPMWLARIVPVDYVANVDYVRLMPDRPNPPEKADDSTMEHVGRLRYMESLDLYDTDVTDAGLEKIEGLRRLRHLWIRKTPIGDAGLKHLEALPVLNDFWFEDTRITDDGILDLERALPSLQVYQTDEMVGSDNMPRAMADLDWARSQPVRLAALLLLHRTRSMMTRRDEKEMVASIEALCALDANDKLSLIKLAEARGECIGLLSSSFSTDLPPALRQRLEHLCTDRGIDALRKAVDLGYDNLSRFESDDPRQAGTLWGYRNHPAFPGLVEAIKTRRRGVEARPLRDLRLTPFARSLQSGLCLPEVTD